MNNLEELAVIEGYLPVPGDSSHILITTCNRNLGIASTAYLNVTAMDADEASQFLFKRAKMDKINESGVTTEAQRIVKELNFMPLAIELASMYIL